MISRFCKSVFLVLALGIVANFAASAHAQIPVAQSVVIEPQHRSPVLAALISLIVPGLGEAYANRFESGRYLVASEVLLWGGYAGLTQYASNFQDDMENFAVANAGASKANKGDQNYFAHVGQFQSSDIFNEEQLREGLANQLVPNGQGWSWAAKSDQLHFNDLRTKVQTLDNDRQFMLAAIIVNHLVSAIDAYIVARNFNRSQTAPQTGMRFELGGHLGALYDPNGASISARLTF
jgi:hypothetical protein